MEPEITDIVNATGRVPRSSAVPPYHLAWQTVRFLCVMDVAKSEDERQSDSPYYVNRICAIHLLCGTYSQHSSLLASRRPACWRENGHRAVINSYKIRQGDLGGLQARWTWAAYSLCMVRARVTARKQAALVWTFFLSSKPVHNSIDPWSRASMGLVLLFWDLTRRLCGVKNGYPVIRLTHSLLITEHAV